MHKSIILFLTLFAISCTRSIEEIPTDTEVINGFNVSWRKNVSEDKKNVIRDILNDMIFVKGGIFLMGATQEQEIYARYNEKPAHYVKLSDYYIGKNEITIAQIETLLNVEFSSYEKTQGAPAFSWNDWSYVMAAIREYSNINVDFPTEAQWEYAARGGIYSKGYIFPGGNQIEIAEISENELGIVNLAKGHSEWCKDSYNEYSSFPFISNPFCIQGLGHVIRGGNIKSIDEQKNYLSTRNMFHDCYDDYRTCRVSARSYCDDSQFHLNTYVSCRLVINITN